MACDQDGSLSNHPPDRLYAALMEIPGINSAVADTIASGYLDLREPAQVAETLLRAILRQAQTAVETFCPHTVCCLKLLRPEGQGFECYFSSALPPEFAWLAEQTVNLLPSESYAGLALEFDSEFIVPDIAAPETVSSHPFSTDFFDRLVANGVNGLVAWPVRLMYADEWRPVAVFKVDCFGECIRDNEATRLFFELIVEHFAVAIQFTLLLCPDWEIEKLSDPDSQKLGLAD